jgi:hypothetical protein
MGPDALGIAENESSSTKHDNGTRVPPKTSIGTQNMKTGPDALGNDENESGSAKHENGTRHPPYRQKRVRERKTWKRVLTLHTAENVSGAQNMKMGPDALATAENEYGDAKHENGTRRPQNRWKRVRERKTW